MRTRIGTAMVATVFLAGSFSVAGIADDGNGLADWQGTLYMSGPMAPIVEIIAVNVDFCVYAPGFFNLSFPGEDPSDGDHYVYAYQIFNNLDPHPSDGTGEDPDYVSRFSVGLDQDEDADNCSYLLGTGIVPDGVDELTAGSTQAGWDFTLDQMAYSLDPPAISAILLFTSPAAPQPEKDSAQVGGWQLANGKMPSPDTIPEPTTIALIAAGLGLCGLRRSRK